MQFSALFDFTGRLHPAIVHLPIGILLLACLLELFSGALRYTTLRPAIQTMIFWGMLAAIASVVTGLILSDDGEYEEEFVNPHMWSAFTGAALSVILYFLYRKNAGRNVVRIFSVAVLLMIGITGHLGGTVTRGPEFLTEPFNQSTGKTVTLKPIPDIQHAALFGEVVQPILKEGCYDCHGPKKHKGHLRFDEKEAIIKGGKNKKTVVAGKPEDSEMIKRLLLPIDHEDHMPPKNKPQLTKQQISVLQWWINTGADFNKKVNEVKQGTDIKPVLLALETGMVIPENEETEVPDQSVSPGDTAVIKKLFTGGVMILPVARNGNYLSANFVTATGSADSLMKTLQLLKRQLVSLKLDQANVNDSSLSAIAELDNLRRLQLSNTAITDQGLSRLVKLKELISLNLVGTKVTSKGVVQLKALKKLKYLYLYRTSISAAEREELKKSLPEATIDFGGYALPMLVTDTTEVKFNQ